MCAFILDGKPAHLPLSTGASEAHGSGPGNSYMVTNRVHPGWDFPIGEVLEIRPLPEGRLWWYMSSSETDGRMAADYQRLDEGVFRQHIKAQLNLQAEPQVAIFIHGLDSLWNNAIHDSAVFKRSLRKHTSYQGLIVGFDWPSYGKVDSALHYARSYMPSESSGTIRDNINGSVAAFQNFLQFLQGIGTEMAEDGKALKIDVVCHSEGNYMAMLGLAGGSSVKLHQVVLLAADIDNGAFQVPDRDDDGDGYGGRATNMALLADRVTVYYSNNDDTLVGSQAVFQKYHNPAYGGRLGHTGPAYNQGPQQPNMHSVDCSRVVSDANPAMSTPHMEGVALHCSYLMLPQVVEDIAATLSGIPASEVPHRKPTRNHNDFIMRRAAHGA